MPLDLRPTRTATGRLALIAAGECDWHEFPRRAAAVVDRFGMTVVEKIDGRDERIWITRVGDDRFCVSWDTWLLELTVIAWEDTPDAAVERLLAAGP